MPGPGGRITSEALDLIYAAVAENAGYRQLCAWWRLRGIIDAMLRRKANWLEERGDQAQEGTRLGVAAGKRQVQVH